MNKSEIRIAGLGGQGVILSAYIIGKAISIFEHKYSTMTQSFGPEARGSACSAQLIIADERILYPYLRTTDVLIALSQEAYNKYKTEVSKNNILIIEEDLIKLDEVSDQVKVLKCPATRLAEELGKRIVLNIVMLGFFTKSTGLADADAMRKAIEDSVPKGTEDLNLKAFDSGYNYMA